MIDFLNNNYVFNKYYYCLTLINYIILYNSFIFNFGSSVPIHISLLSFSSNLIFINSSNCSTTKADLSLNKKIS